MKRIDSFKRFCNILSAEKVLMYKEVIANKEAFEQAVDRSLLEELGIVELSLYQDEYEVFVIMDTEASFEYKKYVKKLDKLEDQSILKGITTFDTPHQDATRCHGFLERIYEMDQVMAFSPIGGQLKLRHPIKYRRFVKALELEADEDLLVEYKKVHGIGAAWPEITQGMKDIGILDMELYLKGFKAYMIMDTLNDFDHEEAMGLLAQKPRQDEWESHVSKFQRTSDDASAKEKWRVLDLIFQLQESTGVLYLDNLIKIK
ncbi:L-rhamnose mutarotase [Flammeovirgaceae bacterium SG7u.111]|nr:L-rhamnose mutarotase [Flammeovirgaceae bacterium SG7u.132]WPO37617.1 L-rhamnose mutarotase [Flammeovirgaceae bacterium SG7u.111]